MFLTILIVISIFLVLFLTRRYRKSMAALIAWIIGSIVSKKSVEEKPPDRSKQNQKNKNKLKESKSETQISKELFKNKPFDADLKLSDKQSKNKSPSLVLSGKDDKLQIIENVLLTNSDIDKLKLKQETFKKKKSSKSADKGENLALQEKESKIIKVQKSKSLPNFERPVDVSFTASALKKDNTLKNKESLKGSSNKKISKENLSQAITDGSNDQDFITVSHKRQPNKKHSSDQSSQLDSNLVDNSKKEIKTESDKQRVHEIKPNPKLNVQTNFQKVEPTVKEYPYPTNKVGLHKKQETNFKSESNTSSANANLQKALKPEVKEHLYQINKVSDKTANKVSEIGFNKKQVLSVQLESNIQSTITNLQKPEVSTGNKVSEVGLNKKQESSSTLESNAHSANTNLQKILKPEVKEPLYQSNLLSYKTINKDLEVGLNKKQNTNSKLEINKDHKTHLVPQTDKTKVVTRPEIENIIPKRKVTYSKEESTSIELKSRQKLRKVQSETGIIVNKEPNPKIDNTSDPNNLSNLKLEPKGTASQILDTKKISEVPQIHETNFVAANTPPKKVSYTQEEISTSKLEKREKLRKIQSETELIVKKETKSVFYNKSDTNKTETKLSSLHICESEVSQSAPATKELPNTRKAEISTRLQDYIPKESTEAVLIKEKCKGNFNGQLTPESKLKSTETLQTNEHSSTSVQSFEVIRSEPETVNKEDEELSNLVHETVKSVIEESFNESKIKLAEEKTVKGNAFTYTITKSIENLPPSDIIEHFKSKHKASSFSRGKGVLLESSIGHTGRKVTESDEISSRSSNDTYSLSATKSEHLLHNNPIDTMKATQVRVLTLNDNEHQETTLYRIEKNWILEFRLGPSLLGRKVALYCNYPEQKNVAFDRNKYYLLPWSQDEGCRNSDDTALFAQLIVNIAGSYNYYFIYENATESGPQGSGFFLVDPVLRYADEEELPLNCIQCQTVLSKCLGPFSTWENKLRVSKESGYNMIHFTPIQELGESNSAYSLSSQLKLNPIFNENGKNVSFADVEKLMSKIRKEWKVLSICDIVLNHTANETDWLEEHPEGTYNCFSCPYMRPAYLVDAALAKFSEDVKHGFYENMGIPSEVNSEDHLNSIRYSLHTKVLHEINIAELFICDVNKLVSEFQDLARKNTPTDSKHSEKKLKLVQDPEYRRNASRVDMNLALQVYNVYRSDSFDEEARIKRCSEEFKNELDHLNSNIINEINNNLNSAVENVISGIRYFRVQQDGPKIKEISVKNPLSSRYFTDYGHPKSIKEYEEIMYSTNSKYLMAHNGWVMNADPMRNFADSDSSVYIRRELIAWGDSVKLRYGEKPEDCPFLWNHMKAYVEETAKIFDGVRLDNCHSTPIPVAQYLLDCARQVKPDLYVVAELFTNSDNTDNVFVNRLGITSLIREAMSAWNSHEEGRLVYRYGGDPVGAFFQPHVRPLVPSIAHALFLDLTHDNPSPIQKRSVFDLLPSSALVNMACCASGSNRGYDELVNHHIHVVDEDRQYTEWTNDVNLSLESPQYVSNNSGIINAKRCINELHFKLGLEGFTQVYVDQIDPDIVAVTRHRPQTHESVILVAFTAFCHPRFDAANYQTGIKPLRVEGILDEIILEASLSHVSVGKNGSKFAHPENFIQDHKWINGLSEYQVDVKEHIQITDSNVFELADSGSNNIIQLNFKNFKPGSVVAIRVSLHKTVQESISKLRDTMSTLSKHNNSDLLKIISKLNLADLNRALYRCDQEEKDEGNGFSTYSIPNFGSMVYCGFQGFASLLSTIRPSNDLGHPMCNNLRDGNWMIDYISQRLKLDDGTKLLGQWIHANLEPLNAIPRYLVPSYFDVAITSLYALLLEQSYHLMSDFVKNGSSFVKGLSLGSLQFAAVIKSADLPILSPNLAPPKPLAKVNNHSNLVQTCVTLSAGLPHFSIGYMRNWGRDTFIALRGLFILTGRFEDARYHILGYAACLRHGLIPNLLDGGKNPRFNCRDAVWWWLYCIKSYVEEAPNGINILSDKVSRIFPNDDSPPQPPGVVDQPLYEVMQECLRIHFQGLVFRERNAGRHIDAHMTDKGFNNQIGIHPETGFVFGGNDANCGTWMDKMGSSDKASNKGKPATPRDGSAIELIGLSKAVIKWLSHLHKTKQYPYEAVERVNKNGTTTKWTFYEWSERICQNFEKHFWINTTPLSEEIRPDLINKRGIYKDSYGATQEWADFQLRCNFPIAMIAAPEMFDPKHAWIALQKAEKYLLGPLGMKTLDSEDWAYCGDYNNSDDSSNLKTANGFNYHQGPEWVWPIGFYLRAKLLFADANGELTRTIANVKVILSKHFTELQTSPWRGLPELTNSNGSYCNDSSRTQAWSMACILEVLHDLQQLESKQTHSKSN